MRLVVDCLPEAAYALQGSQEAALVFSAVAGMPVRVSNLRHIRDISAGHERAHQAATDR
ncbi:hypothetical protein [Streptomyces malaysiensis]|uniref:hypothetical protein n=1 Tax=Streptomyces malaysiensis TaxID=92644 RepID=UPI00321FF39E|nr:hypothetical protein [Streptomyces malaysiensis]